MLPKLSLYNWWLYVKRILANESNSSLAKALHTLFSNYNIYIEYYDLENNVTWIEFIHFMKRYIYNNASYHDLEKTYVEMVLKYLLTYFESHESLIYIDILEDTMNNIRINEFNFLIKKYNKYLNEEHYMYDNNNSHYERYNAESLYYLVHDWDTWFRLRKALSYVFVYVDIVDWSILSMFLLGVIPEYN